MRIAILTRNAMLYSTRRLVSAARRQGHHVLTLDTLRLAAALSLRANHKPALAWPQVDAIIPRIGASVTWPGVRVVAAFEGRGIPTTASAAAIAQSRDKLVSIRLMQAAGLPVPSTRTVQRGQDLRQAVRSVGGPPVVIKLVQSTQGRGVLLARTMPQALNWITTLLYRERFVLLQAFVREAEGRDLRVIVVGETCVAAMRRQAPAGDFRANLHRGGAATSLTLDGELAELAVQAARVHDLEVAGVDLIASSRGPLLLEVNSSPGLEGIERVSGQDVAGAVVRHLAGLAPRAPVADSVPQASTVLSINK